MPAHVIQNKILVGFDWSKSLPWTYNLCQKSLVHPPPIPQFNLDSAMRANLCSMLQFVSNMERWEREVGLANASEYQQFDKDCTFGISKFRLVKQLVVWNTA